MGRKNSLAKNSIQMLCVMQHLDEQNLYERSKLLLSIYRNVCWTACDRAAMLREEAEYCYGRELEEGLLYLNDFERDLLLWCRMSRSYRYRSRP